MPVAIVRSHLAVRRHGPPARSVGVALAVIAAFSLLVAGVASAAPAPNPLPWLRTYIADIPLSAAELYNEVIGACQQDIERGVFDNGSPSPVRITVVGDSVQNQTRAPALADPSYRWTYATHCGEKFATVIDTGRLSDAIATDPDILVAGFGSNNFSENWQVVPALYPVFVARFNEFLAATAHVPCRVLFNISATRHPPGEFRSLIEQANAMYASLDPVAHPNLIVVDWDTITDQNPHYLADDQHLARAGTNARINLALAASRRCLAPDDPANVQAVAGNGTATVWWDPLPPEERVTAYTVTASTGQTVITSDPTANVPGLTNGQPVSFRVRATNQAGTSDLSPPSPAITPSGSGSRFHALSPVRVVDTRVGLGGHNGPLGPRSSFQASTAGLLPPAAATASALVVNVTATGQTAESFVTVWPGGQSRPLVSNLNPKPGLAAIAAMATTRTGPNQSLQFYNDSGEVHLIADVVGWYDAPGSGAGSLYQASTPRRVLDSRDRTGGKVGVFGNADTYELSIPGLPAGTTAVAVNVTSTNTNSNGFVTLYPADQPRPQTSNLNPQREVTRANLTVVKVAPGGAIKIYNNTAATHLVIDLVGTYGAAGATTGGSEYFAITPERLVDSRVGLGGVAGPVLNTADTVVTFAGRGSVPAAAAITAIDLNVTIVGPTEAGHTTAWPTGPRPDVSMLNFRQGEVVPNRTLLGLAAGTGRLWSAASAVHYIADASGWYGPAL